MGFVFYNLPYMYINLYNRLYVYFVLFCVFFKSPTSMIVFSHTPSKGLKQQPYLFISVYEPMSFFTH